MWGTSHTKAGCNLYDRGDYKRALDKAVEAYPLDCGAYLIAGDCLREEPPPHYLTELSMDEYTPEGYYEAALEA